MKAFPPQALHVYVKDSVSKDTVSYKYDSMQFSEQT